MYSDAYICLKFHLVYIFLYSQESKEKAVDYFMEHVILNGPYAHVRCFHAALIAESQENLAATLPIRP